MTFSEVVEAIKTLSLGRKGRDTISFRTVFKRRAT
jgi:hypothetical protein